MPGLRKVLLLSFPYFVSYFVTSLARLDSASGASKPHVLHYSDHEGTDGASQRSLIRSAPRIVHSEIAGDGEIEIRMTSEPVRKQRAEVKHHDTLSDDLPPPLAIVRRAPKESAAISQENARQPVSAESLLASDMLQLEADIEVGQRMLHSHAAQESQRSGSSGMVIILVVLIIIVWVTVIVMLFTRSGRFNPSEAESFEEFTDMVSDVMRGMSVTDVMSEIREAGQVLLGHEEGESFRDVYEVGDKLGDGAFAVVYEIVEISTGKDYAVKMVDMAQSDMEDVKLELKMLRRVRNEKLTVCCLDEFMDSCFYYIIMPKFSGGDLIESMNAYMDEKGLLPEGVWLRCFEQMVAAVEFVHGRHVVHRDVKPENFLTSNPDIADPENRVVLADFGLSVVLKDGKGQLDDLSGTPMFWCPEMLGKTCQYGFGCDIFALGVTGHMLLTSKHPFGSLTELEKWASSEAPVPVPPARSESTQEMLQLAMEREPDERATAFQLQALVRSCASYAEEHEEEFLRPVALDSKEALARGGRNECMDEAHFQRRQKMIHHLDKRHAKKVQLDKVAASGSRRRTVSFELGGEENTGRKGRLNKIEDQRCKLFAGLPFQVVGEMTERREFAWWSKAQTMQSGILGASDESDRTSSQRKSVAQVPRTPEEVQKEHSGSAKPEDIAYLTLVLAQNKVDWLSQWQNPYDKLKEMAIQCRMGETILAEEDRKLIRVVDVVVPVLSSSTGHILVCNVDKSHGDPADADGIKRQISQDSSGLILPGKKRLAWEHRNTTALRALAALGIQDEHVTFTEDREMIIEKKESESCPGITTVYRRHVLHLLLDGPLTSEAQLQQRGWPEGEPLVEQTAERRTTWSWITEESFAEKNLLVGDEDLADRYAAVVPARTHEQRRSAHVREKFIRCGMNPDDFIIEDLAKEEESGECTLIEQKSTDDDGAVKWQLKRVVNLTIVRIVNDQGQVLMEVGKEVRGKLTPCKKLPGIKQRIHENAFLAARRWLTSRLMVHDDEVHFDTSAGGMLSEIGDSKAYPGLMSVYEKQVVQVRLENDSILDKDKDNSTSAASAALPATSESDQENSGSVAVAAAAGQQKTSSAVAVDGAAAPEADSENSSVAAAATAATLLGGDKEVPAAAATEVPAVASPEAKKQESSLSAATNGAAAPEADNVAAASEAAKEEQSPTAAVNGVAAAEADKKESSLAVAAPEQDKKKSTLAVAAPEEDKQESKPATAPPEDNKESSVIVATPEADKKESSPAEAAPVADEDESY